MRLFNERLVLSIIRSHGSISKAEISRLTGLTAQTITTIIRHLDADNLVRREPRVRGKVGQPSTPISLRNDGAYSVGLKIGRRSVELVLIDFCGTILKSARRNYRYPTPEAVIEFFKSNLDQLIEDLGTSLADRISGLGIAIPFELWNWEEEFGVPPGGLKSWRIIDIGEEIGRNCPWPIYQCNDATAACAAELIFGNGARFENHVYLYVGFFGGGGLVVGGNLVFGKSGNAGAFGSMPVPDNADLQQLGQIASTSELEKQISRAGGDPSEFRQSSHQWCETGGALDTWLDQTSKSLAFAIAASAAVLEIDAAIIDGAFPAEISQKLTTRSTDKFAKLDRRGLSELTICSGTLGADARAVGGASLPFLANFTPGNDFLLKSSTPKQKETSNDPT
jgi:predicted NBD/HSP70 family sugar kinase